MSTNSETDKSSESSESSTVTQDVLIEKCFEVGAGITGWHRTCSDEKKARLLTTVIDLIGLLTHEHALIDGQLFIYND